MTQTYYDGTTIMEGGTGQREMETRLELTEEGILTTTLSKGVILSRTLENGFGQTIRQEQPHTKGGFIVTRNLYNDKGQSVRSQTENMAPTVTVYHELGEAVKQTVLLDESHPDDPSRNRISETFSCYRVREDGVYQVQTSTTYNADGLPSLRLRRVWFRSLILYWKARLFPRTCTVSRVFNGRNTPLPPNALGSAGFRRRRSRRNPWSSTGLP